MGNPATAIIFPVRQNYLEAVTEAISITPPSRARLYFDGERCAYLPNWLPGWFPVGAVKIKVAA